MPPDDDDRAYSQQALVQLRLAVDRHFEGAKSREPQAFACQAGCHSCCLPGLSVFGLEAHRIEQALQALEQQDAPLRARVREQGQKELGAPKTAMRCALLVDGVCSVYEQRPLVCRSHGLAVRSASHPTPSSCSLNYAQSAPHKASILNLDAVNQPLSVAAAMWHDAVQGPLRVSLASLATQPNTRQN